MECLAEYILQDLSIIEEGRKQSGELGRAITGEQLI